ncbi:SdrD B-like domain-containing protein [Deferrisoma sp.]
MDHFYSLPSADDPTEAVRKDYGTVGPVTAEPLTTQTVTDIAVLGPETASVGETFRYTILVPATPVNVTLYDVEVADEVPANVVVTAVDVGGDVVGDPAGAPFHEGNRVGLTLPAVAPGGQARVEVEVRVRDVPENADGVVFANGARASVRDRSGGTVVATLTAPDHEVRVVEPDLVLAKTGPETVDLLTPAEYVLEITNRGTGPGRPTELRDVLPEGMRRSEPGVAAVERIPASGDPAPLAPGDYQAEYDPDTGTLTLRIPDGAAELFPGEGLRVRYLARLDPGSADGLSLTNTARIAAYASGVPGGPDVRAYRPDPAAGTPDPGDDHRADHTATSRAPVVRATLEVDAAEASPGTALRYTARLRNDGPVPATAATFACALPGEFEPGSVVELAATAGETQAPGDDLEVRVTGIEIPAGGEVTVSWSARLVPALSSGTVVRVQGTLEVAGFEEPFLTDSAAAADDDGEETGNEPADPADDDPTLTRIHSSPRLVLQLTADTGGRAVLPGDTLTYTFTLTNTGDEHARNVRLRSPVPAGTTYVPGSTVLSGAPVAAGRAAADTAVPVPDAAGGFPLADGIPVQAPGRPEGRVERGDVVRVSFRVTLDPDLANGAVLSAQGEVLGEGEGSGPARPVPSDDPETSVDPDPTQVVVGDAPALGAVMTWEAPEGVPVSPGDPVEYTVVVRNGGVAAARNVRFTNPLPAALGYEAGSLTLDPDGDGEAVAQPLADPGAGEALAAALGDLDPGQEAVIRFRTRVAPDLPAGTVIAVQGTVSADGVAEVATDADPDPENGRQPARLTVGNVAALVASARAVDLNGGRVEPGDTLEFLLEVANVGARPAEAVSAVQPTAPAGAEYLPGTTTLNGAVQPDPGPGRSALDEGLDLGDLGAGETVAVRFRARVTAAPGDAIETQATLYRDGAPAALSDSALDDGVEAGNDPADPNDDDPVRVQVGARPSLAALAGEAWRDLDHDGARDAGEPAAEGWAVELLQGETLVATTATGPDGAYAIGGIPPGSGYEVRFRHPVTGVVYGGARSASPEADTREGTIRGLTLRPGVTTPGQNLALDPSGIVYDSVERVAVEGAVVRLEGPAGFDPDRHLLPGQQDQRTGPDGAYRFDLVGDFPAGEYRLQVTPPGEYVQLWPSGMVPPRAEPLDPTGGPDPYQVSEAEAPPPPGEDGRYHPVLALAPGDPPVVNHHLPVDPFVDGALVVRKTTPVAEASRGDLVPYTITVRNTLPTHLSHIDLVDLLPPGFKYVGGSGRADGNRAEPVREGRQVIWKDLSFGPEEEREFRLVAVVGAGVGEGKYVNQAWARHGPANRVLSNVSEATVRVVPDPTFDCAEVIGRVFDDRNANSYPDDGEPGLPGVRLATARGLVVETDPFGRFHLACVAVPDERAGSNFVLKVDETSLPLGYRPTSENPRVVRLTRGKAVKVNFGAAIHRIVRLEVAEAGFEPGTDRPGPEWQVALAETLEALRQGPAELLVAYLARDDEAPELVRARLGAVAERVGRAWQERGEPYPLVIHRETAKVRPLEPGRPLRPFALSADGDPDRPRIAYPVWDQRECELALARHDIQMRYDPLRAEKRLNVTAWPSPARPGEPVRFAAYWNYGAWVRGAEVRIFRDGDSPRAEPLAVAPVGADGLATWVPPAGAGPRVRYVLRVRDGAGRFDETEPQELQLSAAAGAADPGEAGLFRGYGENRIAVDTSPVEGGTVTVNGRGLAPDRIVRFMGRSVPTDPNGDFVHEEIVPAGPHEIRLRLPGPDGGEAEYRRTLYIPQNGWFLVGIADLTVGQSRGTGPIELVTADDDAERKITDPTGRVAFYLKGKIRGDVLLTASLDTGEGKLEDLLSNLDDRDPRQLLRRLDPDRYYPVYGDDSTTTEDAPTQGRLYVRLEQGESHVLWGNFHATQTETELAQVERSLYGAKLHWVSDATTSFGERRITVDGFAADPGTLYARDEFRGTGGSLYYLRHQNITVGSEKVRVEVRDRDTGQVLHLTRLAPDQDYEIDPIQGRIVLTEPLPSTAPDGFAVRDRDLAGNPVYLVVAYEYPPTGVDTDELATGGRVSAWVTERLRVGVSGSRQDTTGEIRDLVGADVTLRHSAGTYVKAEVSRSRGPGGDESGSPDGGFTFGGGAVAAPGDTEASAGRVEVALDFADVDPEGPAGKATAYWELREAGFAAPGRQTARDTTEWGVAADISLSETSGLRAEHDAREEAGGESSWVTRADLTQRIAERWLATVGLGRDERRGGTGQADTRGVRSDLAGQLEYAHPAGWALYGFAQTTVERTGDRLDNDRQGVGGRARIGERLTLSAEASGGDGGFGGTAQADYAVTDRTQLYLSYQLTTDRTDGGSGARQGNLTTGGRTRFTDTTSLYAEERLTHGDARSGLTHAFGVDFAPDEAWAFGFGAEVGTLEERNAGRLDRRAATVSAGYRREGVKASSSIEARRDESDAETRTTWLMRNGLTYRLDDDWQLLTKYSFSVSRSSRGEFYDGDFRELVVGFAYRPVRHDRLNALVKYTFFEDLPSPGQLAVENSQAAFSQRSHVFSADATYDLVRWLSVGGKYGLRLGEIRPERDRGEWFSSTAHLAVLRTDLHLVRRWDVLVEGRWLHVEEARDTRRGALAALYRHVGRNLKFGVGYNFTDFSDDLTDLSYDDRGWFVNLVGKF